MPTVAELKAEDVPAVGAFLREVFQGADPRLFTDEALLWKAFSPHPWKPPSRSYGIASGGRIAAHAIAMPLEFESTAGQKFHSQGVIDWAARNDVPGAGAQVYLHLAKQVDFQVCPGGSSDAQKVLPRMGFLERGKLSIFRRVLQPLRYNLQGSLDAKTPLRAVRDYGRLLQKSPVNVPSDWKAQRVQAFDPDTPMPTAALAHGTIAIRSPELLNYLLTCPLAKMEGYRLTYKSVVSGYALFSRLREECRVADLWIASDDPQRWREAIALVTELARASSVMAGASTALECEAWLASGYTCLGYDRVFVNDRRKVLPEEPMRVGLIDYDRFYL